MTVAEALRVTEARLADAGVDSPLVDAELLVAHVLGTSRSAVYSEREREVPGALEELANVGDGFPGRTAGDGHGLTAFACFGEDRLDGAQVSLRLET